MMFHNVNVMYRTQRNRLGPYHTKYEPQSLYNK